MRTLGFQPFPQKGHHRQAALATRSAGIARRVASAGGRALGGRPLSPAQFSPLSLAQHPSSRTNTLLTNLNAEKLSPTAPIFLRGSTSRSKKSRLKDLNPEVFMDESPLRAMRDAFAADGSLSAAEANRQGSSAPRHCLLPSRAWT